MAMNPYLVKEYNIPNTLEFFRAQFHEMILMDKAHGMMLVKQGLLSPEDYQKIGDGLDKVDATMTEADVDGELGDLYFNMTEQLYKQIGHETADLVHLGRSRNDMSCACNRMQIRRELWKIMEMMNSVMDLMTRMAGEHLDSVITYYTFGQPAQPGTLAHYLLLCFDILARDYKRLQAAYSNTNRSPMGAAAGIGTGYPLDRAYISDLLGFDGVIENTIDAIATPDYLLEVESAVAIMMSSLSKMAQDLFFWCSYEYGLLDVDLSVAGGSSIMPQKKNPTVFEQMRASSAHAIGLLNDSLALTRNTSLFPNMESTVEMFYTFDTCMRETCKALGLLQAGLENITLRKERSYEYTRNNFTGATTMAEVLSQTYHVPFTETHHIIHGMIVRLMENGTMEAKYLTGELMAEISEQVLGKPLVMTDEEVQRMVDPMYCLNHKVTGGTPKPADTEYMLRQRCQMLEQQKSWLANAKDKVEKAYAVIAAGN